jgi:hypothetical protein
MMLELTDQELEKLRVAMNWVIPADSVPGAGTEVCVRHLLELIDSLEDEWALLYRRELPSLQESDLAISDHPFAPHFIDHVRDCYYGHPDTGAWEDIGFTHQAYR